VVAHRLLGTYARDIVGGANASDTVLPIIGIQVVLMITGIVLVKGTIAQLPTALMGSMMGQGSAAGRLMVRAMAGILLVIPGFFLDVVAILLLLPPVQALFASLGQRLVMSLVRQQMAKMFPGGMPGGGMPGGFPGMPGGFPGMGAGFPGMQARGPLKPDAQVRRGKVVDVSAERVDKD
jgi:UPF0716 protein FxsA